jgi:2-iminoacetate synthase ThiH
VGLGEDSKERFEVISEIADIYIEHKHVQEFIIQGYILNENTKLPLQSFLTLKELVDLYNFLRQKMPGVTIQVQPNTMDFWLDLIKLGADSIGAVSEEIDYVVPRYDDKDLKEVALKLKKSGFKLQKQLPLTVKSYNDQLYSSGIKGVLSKWLKEREYKFYRK